jgi:type IX secretion system PorP/SprF family membrane protein
MMPLMKKNSIAVLFLLYAALGVYGQQEPQVSHNMFNTMAINPGYAGLRNAICATAIARQQWVGFRDEEQNAVNPETYSFTVDAPLPIIRGGLSLGFLQDKLGYEQAMGVKLGYAYHLPLNTGILGIGAQIGFIDKRFDFSAFKPITDGDPALVGSDEESRIMGDGALGVFFMSDQNYWGGISISQIRQASTRIGNIDYQNKRNFYFTSGYNYSLPANNNYVISPSFLLKTDLGSIQADLNTLITYRERFWGGASYRLQDAAVIFLGLAFEQINIGYSYDFTLSSLGRNGRSWGSHEILLRYCFNLELEKVQQRSRNVRFL